MKFTEFEKKLLLVAGVMAGVAMIGGRGLYAYITNQATTATSPAANALFVPVHNEDNVAHEVGDVVVWSDNTHDGVDVTTTTSANAPLVAGVVAIKDIPASGYGLVQVAGYHSAVTISVANSAGDALVTSTTGESAGVFTVTGTTTTTGTAATSTELLNYRGVFGVALEAGTSSTTIKAIIRAL
jgi:hypothetical protein